MKDTAQIIRGKEIHWTWDQAREAEAKLLAKKRARAEEKLAELFGKDWKREALAARAGGSQTGNGGA